ncbi:hypothetical protein A9Q74_09095 [Colwellia sp. 39_35_sub15_T18]|nr:hypothetical protein A9Q74_09095 [Colwellia sp. 39_35_sub15_T18]
MRFIPYIKFSPSYFTGNNPLSLTVLLLLTLLISACSSMPEKTDSAGESNDLKSMSKNITDLVALPSNAQIKQIQTSNGMQQTILKSKNTYLEQEELLMNGVAEEVIATYQQALVLMKQQEWYAANALFEQVIAKQANLSGSYVNQALILTALSKQQQGAKATEQANQSKQAKQPKQANQVTASELLLDKAISVNPLNPYAHYFKGQLLQEKGQFEQAEQYYATALSIWPNYRQAQLDMAVLLELYRGKLLDAYQYYAAYLQLNVDDKQVQRWQAALAIKIKRAGLTLPVQEGE